MFLIQATVAECWQQQQRRRRAVCACPVAGRTQWQAGTHPQKDFISGQSQGEAHVAQHSQRNLRRAEVDHAGEEPAREAKAVWAISPLNLTIARNQPAVYATYCSRVANACHTTAAAASADSRK